VGSSNFYAILSVTQEEWFTVNQVNFVVEKFSALVVSMKIKTMNCFNWLYESFMHTDSYIMYSHSVKILFSIFLT